MKKLFCLFCILFIVWHLACAQSAENVYMDSLISQINQVKSDSQKLKLYTEILQFDERYLPEERLQYEQPAIQLAEKSGNKKRIAMIRLVSGRLYYRLGKFDEALQRHREALSIFEELRDTTNILNALRVVGQDQGDGGNFKEALSTYTRALHLAEKKGDLAWQESLHLLIGWAYGQLGNYPESTNSNMRSLKIAEQIGDTYTAAVAISNIAGSYSSLGNYEKAKFYLFRGADEMKKANDKINLVAIYLDIGGIYENTGDPGKAMDYYILSRNLSTEIKDAILTASSYVHIGDWYYYQGSYAKALPNFNTAIDLYRSVSDKQDLIYPLGSAGICYTYLNQYKQAYACLKEANLLSDQLRTTTAYSTYYGGQEKLDSALGNWKNAYFNYKLYVLKRDSINDINSSKKSLQVNMQYEFDKMEDAAKAEQEKKDVLAAANLKRQKIVRNGFVGGFSVMLLFAGVFFTQRNRIKKGKRRSDELLLNILPSEVAEELKEKGSADAKHFDEVSVLFTDFKNFTAVSENLSAQELVNEINFCYIEFDKIISRHGLEKIKTIGDAYMCAGGLPVPNTTNGIDTVKAAVAIRNFMLEEKQKREAEGKSFFEIRIGVHSGPVVAGIVGIKKFAYDIWGDTVNIAARMESSGEAGKVNISGVTYELVKDVFHCTHRGKIDAKNKGMIDMYFVEAMS